MTKEKKEKRVYTAGSSSAYLVFVSHEQRVMRVNAYRKRISNNPREHDSERMAMAQRGKDGRTSGNEGIAREPGNQEHKWDK